MIVKRPKSPAIVRFILPVENKGREMYVHIVYTMARQRVARKRMARKPRVARKPAKALSKAERKEVKALVKGQAETKRTAWYSSLNDGTSVDPATGFFNARGYSVQNNRIVSNTTDIMRLIPNVIQGIDDFNRIGNRIRPTSLIVNGHIRVNIAQKAEWKPLHMRVCIYVLQHVQLKDYESLRAQNNFLQLLDTQEGATTGFVGDPQNENMRVADQYYKVHAKRIINLEYAGIDYNTANNGTVSIANSHKWFASYSFNLTKALPKVLKYPDPYLSGPAPAPEFLNAPTNSSLFMCMGFVLEDGSSGPSDPANAYLQQEYVSHLSFKDM